MLIQNFEKGKRIKIKKSGVEVDQAKIEEVKGIIIFTRCDKIPGEVIEFEYNKDKGYWYYASGGPKGNAVFSQFLPYTLIVV